MGGTCGFCGYGEGYLGEMGDETTQLLSGTVREGEPGDWTYKQHPNAAGMRITWCGECVGGLKHKYQRHDDTNLRAEYLSTKLRLELDGIRWAGWEADEGKERDAIKPLLDDPAIHLDKLRMERDIRDMENEQFRRYGHDLTKRGWRP